MSPKEWLDVVSKVGLPIAILALVLWKVWPFLERRVEHSEQLAKHMMESNQARWVEISKEFVFTIQREQDVLRDIVSELKELRRELRK